MGVRPRVTVKLEEMRRIDDAEDLHILFNGFLILGNESGVMVRSSMAQTIVSFTVPEQNVDVVGAQDVSVRSRHISLAASTNFSCEDSRMASLFYMVPSAGDAGVRHEVTLVLSQFSANDDQIRSVSLVPESNVFWQVLSYEDIGHDQTKVVVTLRVESTQHGIKNFELAPCADKTTCPTKVVPFQFTFFNPDAVRAHSFEPMAEIAYGSANKDGMKIKVQNLPQSTKTEDVWIEFFENVTASSISCWAGTDYCTVFVHIPESVVLDQTKFVHMRVHLLGSGIV